jgi:hypothetical protein
MRLEAVHLGCGSQPENLVTVRTDVRANVEDNDFLFAALARLCVLIAGQKLFEKVAFAAFTT